MQYYILVNDTEQIPFLDWMQWKLDLENKPYYRIGQNYFYPWEVIE